ncbi:MAG: heparan-alpha-glucosaminide N-acetyltransferase domain-containing protein [Vicinamibacterales bacterium]
MAFAAAGHPARHHLRGSSLTDPSTPLRASRKVYLDWVRGLAVVIMVEAHVVDAWTREADRQGPAHMYAIFVAGLAAPLFLFLAGLALAMSASNRASSVGVPAAARLARLRGWQVFALAFLFRLQSQLLGWGALINFLKVDILNVMGLGMVAAGALWGLGRARGTRIALFAIATSLVAMSTPFVREAAMLAPLPDPLEAYIRPLAGRSTFAIFPWVGFLLAGAIVGELVSAARGDEPSGSLTFELRLQAGLFAAGVLGIVLAYWASFQPSIYPVANFWTSSPTFFFIRLGICTVLVPMAWLVSRQPGVMASLGRSSLFVYWIHVEMVYGVLGRPFRHLFPLPGALIAWAALCVLLYAIVLWKNRLMERVTLTGLFRIFAPVLK